MLEVFQFRSAYTSYNDQHIIIRILPLKGVSRQGMSLQVFLSWVYRPRIDLADLSSPVWSCFFLYHFTSFLRQQPLPPTVFLRLSRELNTP